MPSLTGLGTNIYRYPHLKVWAFFWRPARRDWGEESRRSMEVARNSRSFDCGGRAAFAQDDNREVNGAG